MNLKEISLSFNIFKSTNLEFESVLVKNTCSKNIINFFSTLCTLINFLFLCESEYVCN